MLLHDLQMNFKARNVRKKHYVKVNSFHKKFTPEFKSKATKTTSQKEKEIVLL